MSSAVEYDPEPLYAVEIPIISDKTRARVIEEAVSWHVLREVREPFIKTIPVTVDVTRFRV
jgi:hypothetical protein